MISDYTICVLLFGDYNKLARRCLVPLRGLREQTDVRVGLNQVCENTREIAAAVATTGHIWEYTENRHKYPVMREMIQGVAPITTPYTMWFDDDSYIDVPLDHFFGAVDKTMANADMLGSLYTLGWIGQQREFVRSQSWYNGKDPNDHPKIRFATGGWWCIRTELLYKFNYPWPDLDHRGGDVMLGELMYQQDLRLKHFKYGVKINADDAGRESQAARRGFDQPPFGAHFDVGISETLHRATGSPPLTTSQQESPPLQPRRRRIIEL